MPVVGGCALKRESQVLLIERPESQRDERVFVVVVGTF